MTTYSWKTASNGDWSAASAWTPSGPPNSATADAVINLGGTYTVTIAATKSFTVNSATLSASGATLQLQGTLALAGATATLALQAGTIALSGVIQGGTVAVSGGTFATTGAVSYGGAYIQTGGTLGGTGTLTLKGATTLTGGYEQDAGKTLLKGATTIGFGGESGDALYLLGGRVLENDAALNWVGGDIRLQGATLRNVAGATFTAKADGTVINYGGTDAFINAGTFTKSGGVGSTTIQATFTNTGTVNVNTGTLQLSGGGGSTGTFNVGADATLAFGHGGLFDITGGGITGTGALLINGSYNTDILQFDVAAALAGSATVKGGLVAFNQTASVAGAYSQSGGYLGGTGTVTLTGATTLTGGYQQDAGKTLLKGGTTIGFGGESGDAQYLFGGRVLENDAALNWVGGDIRLQGATLRNVAGATFTAKADGTVINYGSTDAFINAGTFTKAAGAGSTTIQVAFTNSGTVAVNSGTLQINGGGGSTGTFAVGPDATLAFGQGGLFDITSGGITGTGALLINGYYSTDILQFDVAAALAGSVTMTAGQVAFNQTASVAGAYSQAGGYLGGVGTVTLKGPATLTGGYQHGTGTTVLKGATTVGFGGESGDAQYLYEGRVLENDAALNWLGGDIRLQGGTLRNIAGATFTAKADGTVINYGSTDAFINAGTFTKAAGAGSTTIQVAFTNSGTVAVNSGTLQISGGGSSTGTFAVGADATLAFGQGGLFDVTGGGITGTGALLINGSSGSDILQFDVAAALAGSLTLKAGQIAFNQTASVAGAYSQAGGYLGGVGTLTVKGTTTLTGGYQHGTGTTVLKGATTIGFGGKSGDAQYLYEGRVLENDAGLNWAGGDIRLQGATLRNVAGATFTAKADGTVINYGSTDAFINAGTFTKSAGAGSTTIQVAFTNSGSVAVNSGTLQISGGGSSTGTFAVATDATLAFGQGGLFDVTGGGITGTGALLINGSSGSDILQFDVAAALAGSLTVTAGQVAFNQTASVAGAYSQAGGYLGGAGTLTLQGPATLTGGYQHGTGTTVLKGATTVGFGGESGTSLYLYEGRVLENDAALNWVGGNIILQGGTLRNAAGATFTAKADGTVSNYGNTNAFLNAGTFTKAAGAGTTAIQVAFTNTGTVAVNSGTLSLPLLTNLAGTTLTGGTYSVSNDGTLQLANDVTIATLAASVTLSGTSSAINSLSTATYPYPEVGILSTLSTVTDVGALRLLGGRSFTAVANAGTFTLAGLLQLGGGTVDAAKLKVASTTTILGFGVIKPAIGSVALLDAVNGGTLALLGKVSPAAALEADRNSVLQLNQTALATVSGRVTLNGAGSKIQFGTTTFTQLESSLTSIAATGTLSVLGGRGYVTTNAITDSGALVVAGGTFTAASLTVASGAHLTGSGTFTNAIANSGTIESSGGLLKLAAGATGTGTFVVDAASTLELAGTTGAGTITDNGVLKLDGITVTASKLAVGSTGTLVGFGKIAAPTGNAGLLDVVGGTLAVTGAVSGTGALRADANAVLQLNQAALATITGSVTLSGAGSKIQFGTTSFTQLESSMTSIAATGQFSVLAGRGYVTTKALSDGGVFVLGGGTLTAASLSVAAGGQFSGFGTITNAVSNAGTIAAGGGTLAVSGALTESGTLSVGAGAVFAASGGGSLAGSIGGAGTLSLAGSATFTSSGALDVGTAAINAANVAVGSGKLAFLGAITNNGTISTGGNAASFSASVGGTGAIRIGGGGIATLLAGSGANETLSFLAATGTLALGAPLSFGGTISGFVAGDTIDLLSTAATSESFAGGVLTVKHGATAVASLKLAGSYTTASFHLGSDGAGGTFITHT